MPLKRHPELFSHRDWLFEVKHDGFRASGLLHVNARTHRMSGPFMAGSSGGDRQARNDYRLLERNAAIAMTIPVSSHEAAGVTRKTKAFLPPEGPSATSP